MLFRIHCGVGAGAGVGFLSCIVPMYISEMSPARVRGTLVSLQQLMLTLGILIAFIVNSFTETSETGWRISLGLSCGLSALLLIGM